MFAEAFQAAILFAALFYHLSSCQILQDKKLLLFAISQNG